MRRMLIHTFTTDRSHCSIFVTLYASLYPEQLRVLLRVKQVERTDMIFDVVYPANKIVSKKGSTCLKNTHAHTHTHTHTHIYIYIYI